MQPKYYLDAAARQAYESFIRLNAWKIGQKISDASGVHRIPSWEQHKTFVKERWKNLAQDVIDAATGTERKRRLTSATDVQGSPPKKSGGKPNEQDLQVRGRQRAKRGTVGHSQRKPSSSGRVDSRRS